MQLTVAIPTYNRNEILKRNLGRLLPQLTPECRLLLIDNASTVPVAQTLQDLLAQFPDARCEIIRNRANIGANANILRCFERCETEWLWVLSDDDAVEPDAIQTIQRHLALDEDARLFNFAYDGLRPATIRTHGVADLTAKLDGSADLPWISASVYRAGAMLDNLKFGYQYAYSMLPHIALLLVSLGETGACHLSPDTIVDGTARATPLEEQWSIINMALGLPVLFDLPLPHEVRRALARKLLRTNHNEGVRLRTVVTELLMTALRDGDRESALYFYDQACLRFFDLDADAKRKASMRLHRVLLQYPRLGFKALELYLKKQGRDVRDIKEQNRYARM